MTSAATKSLRGRALALGRWLLVALAVGVHALLFAIAQGLWLAWFGRHAGLAACAASGSVVLALAWLAPGLAWWLESAPLPPGEALRRVAQQLEGDTHARRQALWATLALHATLHAPALSLGLALALGGWAWGLPVVVALAGPWLWKRARARAASGVAPHRDALLDRELPALPWAPEAKRALITLALASVFTLGVAVWQLSRPAPAPQREACEHAADATRVALPGALPGTPLHARADATAVWLSAPDGGGPGAVPLAVPLFSVAASPPQLAWVERRAAGVYVTLCTADRAAGALGAAHELHLAAEGYRQDDSVTQRVLRSRPSAWLALLMLVLALACARWGGPTLLLSGSALSHTTRPASARAARRPTTVRRTRAAYGWVLLLTVAQLLWALITMLGR